MTQRALLGIVLIVGWASCGAPNGATGSDGGEPIEVTPDDSPDGGAPSELDGGTTKSFSSGDTVRVNTDGLNLRQGPGTSNAIIVAMPCGAASTVIGGPSNGWWNLRHGSTTGWSSGRYLVEESEFDSAVCTGTTNDGGAPVSTDVATILARAKSGVGYSYWWGHGSWRTDGTDKGACYGDSCPSCTHSGGYGADCSGFVAKCWQIPGTSAVERDLHPYSTWNFYNEDTDWTKVPRSSLKPGDALVYNVNGAGHMVLFESASDPWGNLWLYEARACGYGVIHNLRPLPTEFIAVRREGL